MKQLLLLGAAAMMASTALAVEPKVLSDLYCLGLSPDGKTMVSVTEDAMTLVNLETGVETRYEGNGSIDSYSLGQGNAFSDNGILVGSGFDGRAAILKSGEWISLNTPKPEMTSCAQGITPDGLRICGNVGMARMSIEDIPTPMQVPAIWNLQSDGTYGDAVILPYPDKDFTGRVPQYVTAISISDDGRRVVGQVVDYSGSFPSLIFYNLGDDNEWTYDTKFNNLVNPDNLTFPEDPGDGPAAPSRTDFMTEEEKAAYDAAVNDYYAAGDWTLPFPEYGDFMTDEEKAAYQAAYETWESEYAAWQAKYDAFSEVFIECAAKAKALVFNSVLISPDGKRALSNIQNEIDDPMSMMGWSNSYAPVLFDFENGESFVYPDNNVLISCWTDDGSMLGFQETSLRPRRAMVYLPGKLEPITLVEYYEMSNAETAAWVKENMMHDCETVDPETYDFVIVEDMDFTGTPFATPDFSVVATAVQNLWDEFGPYYYSYVLPGYGGNVSVREIASDNGDITMRVFRGGRISITGNAEQLSIFDTDGRMVFNTVPDGNIIETGLTSGVYVARVKTADGIRTIKAIF